MIVDPALARYHPAMLARSIDHRYLLPPHVLFMSRAIRDTVDSGGGNLMFFMPPRHGKSQTVSKWASLWHLERWPQHPVVIASYGKEKAMEWGREIRNTIEENPDKLLVRLSKDSKAAHRWNTPEGGGLMCVGIGGGLTGFGAKLLNIDDPVKDAEEAESAVMREKHWQWYLSVARTRLAPNPTQCLVMTRWHEDDLAGRLIRHQEMLMKEGLLHSPWRVISLPCIAEENDELGRNPGEALWPGYGFDERWAEITRNEVGSRVWASLYQQRPSPAGGLVFKREHFHYYYEDANYFYLRQPDGSDPKRIAKVNPPTMQTVDTAMTEKAQSDFTAALTGSVIPGGAVLIRDMDRRRIDVPDQWNFIMRVREKWLRRGGYLWMGVEGKNSGKTMLQLAQRYFVPLRELEADTDKVSRATDAAIFYERGMIYHPENAPWLDDFESELLSFPNGLHDDQVDVLAYLIREIVSGAVAMLPQVNELVDQDDDEERIFGTGVGKAEDYVSATGEGMDTW